MRIITLNFKSVLNAHIIFYFTGHTITLRRNSKTCVTAARLQAERDKVFADNQANILSIVQDLQQTLLRVTSQLDMKKKVDIMEFFPIKQDSDLQRFLDNGDGAFRLNEIIYFFTFKPMFEFFFF